MIKKIIFLDIDWVLHPLTEGLENSGYFCYYNVKALKRLVRDSGARIVITSDWRYGINHMFEMWIEKWLPPYMWHLDRIEKIEKDIYNIDKTDLEWIRKKEIDNFLKVCEKAWEEIKYVIIDDMKIDDENLFQTDYRLWLTSNDVDFILNNMFK